MPLSILYYLSHSTKYTSTGVSPSQNWTLLLYNMLQNMIVPFKTFRFFRIKIDHPESLLLPHRSICTSVSVLHWAARNGLVRQNTKKEQACKMRCTQIWQALANPIGITFGIHWLGQAYWKWCTALGKNLNAFTWCCAALITFFFIASITTGEHISLPVCACLMIYVQACFTIHAHTRGISQAPSLCFFLLTNLRWPTSLGSVNKKKINIFFYMKAQNKM